MWCGSVMANTCWCQDSTGEYHRRLRHKISYYDFSDSIGTRLESHALNVVYSRSERQLYLYSAESLGSVATAPADVSPSTLIPFYDPDTSVLILTGKVCQHVSICVYLGSVQLGLRNISICIYFAISEFFKKF